MNSESIAIACSKWRSASVNRIHSKLLLTAQIQIVCFCVHVSGGDIGHIILQIRLESCGNRPATSVCNARTPPRLDRHDSDHKRLPSTCPPPGPYSDPLSFLSHAALENRASRQALRQSAGRPPPDLSKANDDVRAMTRSVVALESRLRISSAIPSAKYC